jgi:hypothetical protein
LEAIVARGMGRGKGGRTAVHRPRGMRPQTTNAMRLIAWVPATRKTGGSTVLGNAPLRVARLRSVDPLFFSASHAKWRMAFVTIIHQSARGAGDGATLRVIARLGELSLRSARRFPRCALLAKARCAT